MPAQATIELEKLIEGVSFILKATVIRVDASNEPSVPSRPGLVVGRVDAVLRASPDLGDLVGQEITIELASGRQAPKVGDQEIFYANDWVYGLQIAVREVAHRAATQEAEKATIEALENLPARHLKSRLDGAELVVAGVVESIGPSPLKEPASFNAPLWKVAELRAETVLKGEPHSKQARVLFPSSDDWAPVPQFTEHQAGIFLLRHEPQLALPPDLFIAPDPADFQLRTALRQVQALLPK